MITNNIFFSIIIPAFNMEKYIRRTITSVLDQKFKDFEIIIVNDGSVDKTSTIIDKYAKYDKRITILTHLKNESQHIARLDGVAAANGKYVVFLDGDDYFNENALGTLYDIIEKNPGYDFYEFGYIKQPSGETVFPSFLENDRFFIYFKENHPHTMWNKVYCIQLLKKAFSMMERVYLNLSEDLYESIVIAYYAKKVFIIKEIITNYLIGVGISTAYKNYDKTIEFLNSFRIANNLIENFLKRLNLDINLDNLNYRFMKYAIGAYFITQIDKNDMRNLYLKLPDYFENKIIIEYLFFKEDVYKNFELKYSKEYRLGQMILQPFRKIKRLLVKAGNYKHWLSY